MALETIDIPGVEIARVGGPIMGFGSPPEGEYLDAAYFERVIADTNEVVDELDPYGKLSHDPNQQRLLASKSFWTDGQEPRLGTFRNFRLDGGRVLADAFRVPKRFAELVKAGAYPKRSWETIKFTSQKAKPGKFYDEVIGAVAWLGAQTPAITTLDEVESLFGHAAEPKLVHVYAFEADEQLPPDVNLDGEAEHTEQVADTRSEVAEENTQQTDTPTGLSLTDEQAAELAAHLAIDGDVTVEAILAAAKDIERVEDDTPTTLVATTPPEDGGDGDGDGDGESDTTPAASGVVVHAMSDAQVYDLMAKADRGEAAAKKMDEMERDKLLDEAMRAGKFPAAKLPHYQRLFATNAPIARQVIAELEPNEQYARVYGMDTDGGGADFDQQLSDQFRSMVGD